MVFYPHRSVKVWRQLWLTTKPHKFIASVFSDHSFVHFRSSNFTNDELLQILSYVDCRKMNMSHSLLHFYASNPYLFRELARSVWSISSLNICFWWWDINMWITLKQNSCCHFLPTLAQSTTRTSFRSARTNIWRRSGLAQWRTLLSRTVNLELCQMRTVLACCKQIFHFYKFLFR